jgi:hypothetical protein
VNRANNPFTSIFIWRRPNASRLFGAVGYFSFTVSSSSFFHPDPFCHVSRHTDLTGPICRESYLPNSRVWILACRSCYCCSPSISAIPVIFPCHSGMLPYANICDRLPPPFYQAPTDAEYAMELISRRVAAGQPLFPPKKQRQRSRSNADDAESPTTLGSSSSKTSGIDWKKMNDKVITLPSLIFSPLIISFRLQWGSSGRKTANAYSLARK